MANTKDYSMREMVIDRYLSTGNEFTRKEMQDLINKYLAERDMKTVSSKMTVLNDINEMNGKFSQVYGRDGIVYEDRHGKRYYRYADGISSIYNRELTPDEVEKIINVRMLLKDLHGMPNFNWIDQLLVRFDQQLSGDDRVLVTLDVIVNPELEQELLLYGDHITVLEPESFRKKVLDRVNLLAKNYNIK